MPGSAARGCCSDLYAGSADSIVLERPQVSMSAGQKTRSPAQSMRVYLRELTATCGAPSDKGHLAKSSFAVGR